MCLLPTEQRNLVRDRLERLVRLFFLRNVLVNHQLDIGNRVGLGQNKARVTVPLPRNMSGNKKNCRKRR